MPGITEGCLNKIKYGGIEAMPSSTDECFEMTPARQWKGLWRREFENSRFCPSPAGSCSYQTAGDRIWLSGKALTSSASDEGLYEVEFVGRQTARKGSYGHLSAFDYEIIVDKIINLRPVSDAAIFNRVRQQVVEIRPCSARSPCFAPATDEKTSSCRAWPGIPLSWTEDAGPRLKAGMTMTRCGSNLSKPPSPALTASSRPSHYRPDGRPAPAHPFSSIWGRKRAGPRHNRRRACHNIVRPPE